MLPPAIQNKVEEIGQSISLKWTIGPFNNSLPASVKLNGIEVKLFEVENFDTGLYGDILLLLTIYKATRKEAYYSDALIFTSQLLEIYKVYDNRNLSLYKGLAGFIYLLLEHFELSKDDFFLKESVDLVMHNVNDYYISEYVSDYVYDGRAGTLLLVLRLYKYTYNDSLLDIIGKLTIRILENAKLLPEGVYWKQVQEHSVKPSLGFGMGAAGIGYALLLVKKMFPESRVEAIIDEVFNFINFCSAPDRKEFKEYVYNVENAETSAHNDYIQLVIEKARFDQKNSSGWLTGNIGTDFFRNHCVGLSEIKAYELNQFFDTTSIPLYLSDGLAGVGLYYLELCQTKNDYYYIEAQKIVDHITKILLDKNYMYTDSFLFGSRGVLYFLLCFQSYRCEDFHNLLFPKVNTDQYRTPQNRGPITTKTYAQLFIFKYFYRSYDLIKLNPLYSIGKIDAKFDLVKQNRFHVINSELESIFTAMQNSPVFPLLAEIYQLEKKKLELIISAASTTFKDYIDEVIHHNKVINNCNNSQNWLLNQEVIVNSEIQIIHTKWKWMPERNSESFLNIYTPPGDFTLLFRKSGKYGIIESYLDEAGLILHFFSAPKSIRNGINDAKIFCSMQKEEDLAVIGKNTGSKDFQDFFNRLDFLLLFKIKQLLYEKILVVCKN